MATTPEQLLAASPKEPSKKRIRKAKKKVKSDIHELYDGDCTIFRTTNSGKVFQFQMWIHQQQKYVRKSTKTRNLETAIATGKEYYLDIHTKLRMDEPVFSKIFLDVCNEFLEDKLRDVGLSRTQGRYVTIRSQIKHVLKFVGENTKVTEISDSKWRDYFKYRKTNNPNVVNPTLNNEKNTINGLYRFMVSRRYLLPSHQPQFPKISNESRKREAFSRNDWRTIYTFFRTNDWMKHHNPKTVEQRQFIRDFAIILMNTGLRFGELRKLKWKNIVIENTVDKKESDDKVSVQINLQAEQTKNNKARVVYGRRGDVFTRIKRYSQFTDKDNYIFVDNDSGKQIERTIYYKHWNYLVDKTGLKNHRADNSFYCFRHSYCTHRLDSGLDILTLSKTMGTSIHFIETHYEHIIMKQRAKEIVKDAAYDDSDYLLFD